MRKLANILALCALGTVMAVGCGDDDDDDGGGGTGGSAGEETGGTGGTGGTGTGGTGTGGTGTGGQAGGGGEGGLIGTGVCAVTCETTTTEEDCGEDTAFLDFSCEDGFCQAEPKPCDDSTGADQNCDIGNLGLSACIEADGATSCRTLCDPDAVVDLCAAIGAECTGEGTNADDEDVTFCEPLEVEPSCGEGIDVGDPCVQQGLGGNGGASGDQFGVCTAEGTCTCGSNSQCTADGYACKTE
jgi:hypothetical protein